MTRIYATEEDLAEYLGGLSPAEATGLLEQASLIVEDVLDNSVYDTDDGHMPTEDRIKAAIAVATCKQARFLHDAGGFEAFTSAGQAPSQLGSLRFDGNASDDGGGFGAMVSPEVVLTLKAEGLLSSKVRVLR